MTKNQDKTSSDDYFSVVLASSKVDTRISRARTNVNELERASGFQKF